MLKAFAKGEMVDCIIPLHVLTGCDHNSGFYGIGKMKVAERAKQSPDARQLLLSCGNTLQLTETDMYIGKICYKIYIFR